MWVTKASSEATFVTHPPPAHPSMPVVKARRAAYVFCVYDTTNRRSPVRHDAVASNW